MSTATQERIIRPARNILGTLRLPGDKSISHRYAMLGAFAEGTSRFSNFSTGADCASTLACMQALGAKVRNLDDGRIEIDGVAGRVTPAESSARLRKLRLHDAHDLRPARAATGHLHPHRRRVALAPPHGAHPQTALGNGRAPHSHRRPRAHHHRRQPLHPIDFTTPVPSAQVKTCVLLAGLQTNGATTVRESLRTRDHSELALRAFGATSPAPSTPSPSTARRRFMPSMPLSPATSLPPHSSSAPRRSFPTPALSSTASASTPPAPRSSTCLRHSAHASPSSNRGISRRTGRHGADHNRSRWPQLH